MPRYHFAVFLSSLNGKKFISHHYLKYVTK